MATQTQPPTDSIDVQQLLHERPLPRRDDFSIYWRGMTGAQAPEFRRAAREFLTETEGDSSQETQARAGLAAYLLGRHEEAARRFSLAGDDPTAQFLLGMTLLTLNRASEAGEAFREAQERGFDEADATLKQADATRRRGDLDEAERLVRSVSRIAVGRAEYSYQMGCILIDRGDLHGGVEYFERAADIDPRHGLALFRLGTIAAARSDEFEAIDFYERCLSIPPVHVGALLNLGLLYEDLERYRAAEFCFRQVLDFDPLNERAQLYLRDIEAVDSMYYDEDSARRESRRRHMLTKSIVDFEMSMRSRNCLQAMNIHTLGDLTRVTEEELLAGKNFGETSLEEVEAVMAAQGLRIGESLQEAPAPERPAGPTPGDLSPEEQHLHQQPISELNLTVRARKCMSRLGITTIGELISRTPDDLLGTRNFGVTSLNEIRQKLAEFNLSLRND